MSNYDIMKRNAAGRFLTYDPQKLIDRLSLRSDGEFLYMDLLSTPYRIHRSTGLCERAVPGGGFQEAGFDDAMTLYDILCHTDEPVRLSGELIPMDRLSTVQNASSYAGEGSIRQLSLAFDGREAALAAACEALGGVREGRGDVSYRIPVFGEISLLLSFWSSDEDFPASLKIYCDRDLTRYIFYETVWYMAGHVFDALQREMARREG